MSCLHSEEPRPSSPGHLLNPTLRTKYTISHTTRAPQQIVQTRIFSASSTTPTHRPPSRPLKKLAFHSVDATFFPDVGKRHQICASSCAGTSPCKQLLSSSSPPPPPPRWRWNTRPRERDTAVGRCDFLTRAYLQASHCLPVHK